MDDPPGADYDDNGIPVRRMTDAELAARAALLAPETLLTASDPRTALIQAAMTPLPPSDDDEEIEVQHGEGAPKSRKLRKVIKSSYPGYVPTQIPEPGQGKIFRDPNVPHIADYYPPREEGRRLILPP